jgi:hypothetical protein
MALKLYPLVAEAWKCCPIPLVLVALALTRNDVVLGLLFSSHGGIGWFLLLFAFPWVLVRAGLLAFNGPARSRPNGRRDAIHALLIYAAVAVICSGILVRLLSPLLKLDFGDTLPWFFFPFGLLVQG